MNDFELIEEARREATAGRLKRALDLLSKVIARSPECAEAYFERGHTYYELCDWKAAESDLGRAVSLDPNDEYGLFLLAGALGQLGQHNKQIVVLTRTLELLERARSEGDDVAARLVDSLSARAYAFQRVEQSDRAIADCLRAAEIDGGNVSVHLQLGRLLSDDFRWLEASDAFSRALKIDPDNVEAIGLRARCLGNSGGNGRAVEEYERALALEPDAVWIIANLSQTYADLGNYEMSEKLVRRALVLNPEWGFAHSQLGSLLVRKGEVPEALKEAELAVHYDTDFPVAYDSACIYARCSALVAVEDSPRLQERAIELLRLAHQNGWKEISHTLHDKDLVSLRELRAFKDLISSWSNSGN